MTVNGNDESPKAQIEKGKALDSVVNAVSSGESEQSVMAKIEAFVKMAKKED